jgi:hypothetical protein
MIHQLLFCSHQLLFVECLIAVDELSGMKRSSRVRACSIGRGIIRKYPGAIPSAIWKLISHQHLMDTPTSNQSITKSSNYEFMVGKPSLVAAEQLKWVASTDWRFYRRRAALRQCWRETWGLGNFFEFLNYSKFKLRNFLENKSNSDLDFSIDLCSSLFFICRKLKENFWIF